jgi:hypothetical protein
MIRLLRKTLQRLLRALPVVMVLGCGPEPRTADDERARQLCLARVFLETDARADELCPIDDGPFEMCPHYSKIMDDMTQKQAACSGR